jgi:UDP-N-acetylmuramoyl-L-alanyl-D-glutamate--2,6-diaminopimelate ligase
VLRAGHSLCDAGDGAITGEPRARWHPNSRFLFLVNALTRALTEVLAAVRGANCPPHIARLPVTGITMDSRQVQKGNLYLAIPGTRVDGHDYVADAAARGACAAVVEREVSVAGVPVIRVPNSRRALAEVAAEWHGNPAERLSVVGVTGSFGKTTVVMMLDAIAAAAGQPMGAIGSEMVGIRLHGQVLEQSPYTTPDALLLHRAFAMLRDRGADRVAMEVTSHALAQERVHGVGFDLGVFTNLAPLEHKEYHPTFEHYVRSKLRFFEHLRPGAPLVYFAEDPSLQRLVPGLPVTPISCGTGADAAVRFEVDRVSMDGTRIRLSVRKPLPRWTDRDLPPQEFALDLPLLGQPYTRNAAFAATVALIMGAEVGHIRQALGAFTPPRRRMQVIPCGEFTVLDDTAQHPDSLSAVFKVVRQLPHRHLHIAYAIRGQRGPEINHQLATALGIWASQVDIDTLVLTSSVEAVDERNRVEDSEKEAFVRGLSEGGVRFEARARLDEAVQAVLDRAGAGDLVLFLGPFGMHGAARILDGWCAEHGVGDRGSGSP